ncbi:hypothetical protein LguiB_031555 [Lonicera macranthoides]
MVTYNLNESTCEKIVLRQPTVKNLTLVVISRYIKEGVPPWDILVVISDIQSLPGGSAFVFSVVKRSGNQWTSFADNTIAREEHSETE